MTNRTIIKIAIAAVTTLLTPVTALSQLPSTLLLQTPAPPPVSQVSAAYGGSFGTNTYYFWVVATYPPGNVSAGGPGVVRSIGTVSASLPVTISWNPVSGATSYDVLQTLVPTPPSGACACAVATGLTTSSTTWTGGALSAYSVTAFGMASGSIGLNNSAYSIPTLVGTQGGLGGFLPLISGTVTTGQTITRNADGTFSGSTAGGGAGTVTSVGLTMPVEFSVANSPVTGAATLVVTKVNATANTIYAGPTTGAPAAPTFRVLVAADLPATYLIDPGSNGFVDRTSAGVTAARTLTGTANQITVTNGGGGGNPVFSIATAFDLSGLTSTAPSKAGTSLPATCSPPMTYVKTDATNTNQLYICTAANTWTAQGGAGSGNTITNSTYTNAACATAGDAIFTTDGGFVEVCNGSTYNKYGPLTISTVMLASSFTAVNLDGSTITDAATGLVITSTDANSEVHLWHVTAPATPYTVRFRLSGVATGTTPAFGVGFRESGTQELKLFSRFAADITVGFWNSATSFNTNSFAPGATQSVPCFEIGDTGVSRTYKLSADCKNYIDTFSEGRTTDLTADQWVIFVRSSGAAAQAVSATFASITVQ